MKSKAYNYLYVCLENLPQWDTFYIYICYLQNVDMYQNIRTPPDQTPTTPYQLYIYICYLQIVDMYQNIRTPADQRPWTSYYQL